MSTGYLYEPLPDIDAGLRLHLNENTAGCSPAVLRAIMRADARRHCRVSRLCRGRRTRCAAALGVDADAGPADQRPRRGHPDASRSRGCRAAGRREAVVVEPAYGHVRPVGAPGRGARRADDAPAADSASSSTPCGRRSRRRRASCSSRARTTRPAPSCRPTTSGSWRAAMPPGGAVFVDEAYADFEGHSVIGDVAGTPNLIVGRTFAKAYGLAGMRIGCLVAAARRHPAAARRHRAVQRERLRGRGARGRPRGPRVRRVVRQPGARVAGAALRRLRRDSACPSGGARPTSCSCGWAMRRRCAPPWPRGASTCATGPPRRAARAASASRRASSTTRRPA